MITQFVGNISTPIEIYHILVIAGKSIDVARSFYINLVNGRDESDLIPLQISVKFNEGLIERNTKDENGWGAGESEENLSEYAIVNPIVAGDNFKIYILIGDEHFHIAINDQPYCTYKFRLPISDIQIIDVRRDVQSITQIDHRAAYPTPYPLTQPDDLSILFSNDIPTPFLPGHVICITAIASGNPKGMFAIRFTKGVTMKKILNFMVQFDPYSPTVIRNASSDNNILLDADERYGDFPFKLNHQFRLAIAFTETEFKFAIDGKYFCSFEYRTIANPLNTMSGLKILNSNGLQLEVTAVDHMHTGRSDCNGFEEYSHPDYLLNL